jgi:hypothetical protein
MPKQQTDASRKVDWVKDLCLLASLFLVAGALTGIQSITGRPSGVTIVWFNAFGRFWSLISALVLVAFAYGLHVRSIIAWKAGFVLWSLCYLQFAIGAVTGLYHTYSDRSFQSFWLPVSLVVLVGGTTAVYGGFWWKRLRSGFL